MACGATLKRSMEFEALLSPQSPKRRRCTPLPGSPATPSPQRCGLRQESQPGQSASLPQLGGDCRLTPGSMKKDQPSFSLRQVGILCERLLKDHEEKIREEYEQILNTKLEGQF
ncbi:hypothetical protein GDO81_005888 [Engystomops pustulosus]|uniref:Akirin 1 n=1 Tax=Engystomops pustulosus TaxID=76066 RepID=A0AAV7CSP0_ENGPU|nr:hypothetical protein GDO81_005888 [Engystomops pustulosus]